MHSTSTHSAQRTGGGFAVVLYCRYGLDAFFHFAACVFLRELRVRGRVASAVRVGVALCPKRF